VDVAQEIARKQQDVSSLVRRDEGWAGSLARLHPEIINDGGHGICEREEEEEVKI